MADYAIYLSALPSEDGGGWLATVPDLPGCQSDGQTRQEALFNAELAILEWLDVQAERDVVVPAPGSAEQAAHQKSHDLRRALDDILRDYNKVIHELDSMNGAIAERDDRIARLERKHRELLSLLAEDGGRGSHVPLEAFSENLSRKNTQKH